MTTRDSILWIAVPYTCLAVFIVGHYWRYRYDKFGWTTRSSQMYESRLLRWASPLFHFGILAVFLGHVLGLAIPKGWTDAIGISEGLYHVMAVAIGGVAGVCTLVGAVLLIYRRRTVGPVFMATTRMDKAMWFMLALVIALGLWNTAAGTLLNLGGEYNYRTGVSEWYRSIFYFSPRPELMAEAPWGFQAHAMVAMLLFAMWPFTRLVHVFSAPLWYLWRPYVVYRSKAPQRLGTRAPRRGWEQPQRPTPGQPVGRR